MYSFKCHKYKDIILLRVGFGSGFKEKIITRITRNFQGKQCQVKIVFWIYLGLVETHLCFLFHEVDGQGSLDSMVADEEVQGKSDVGASEDPPLNCDFKHFLQLFPTWNNGRSSSQT